MHYHSSTVTKVLKFLKVEPKKGHTLAYVRKQQAQGKRNIMSNTSQHDSARMIFFRQWKSPLILILVVAAVISGLMHEYVDMGIIGATALINALIGFFQEYKANKALEHLQKLVTVETTVIRDGKKQAIAMQDIVVGDIVLLMAGGHVPADGRIIAAKDLAINEAALTGESYAVEKNTTMVDETASMADQSCMAFRGTIVERGEGTMVVTAVGDNTQIGTIATLVKEAAEELTPLQAQLDRLGKHIGYIVLGLVAVIVCVGLWRAGETRHFFEVFETAVAVAVAAIPEGLVISLTIILAVGMQFMVRRKALVRKLVAAETLGSVSVICTDKTGTLTKGEMAVETWFTHRTQEQVSTQMSEQMSRAFWIGYVANDAYQQYDEQTKTARFVGDSTDVALKKTAVFASQTEPERLAHLPFSSDRKFMATIVKDTQPMMFVKGAPDVLLDRCTKVIGKRQAVALTPKRIAQLQEQIETYTNQGFRLLAVAQKTQTGVSHSLEEADVTELTLYGIFVIVDPLREDIADTIALTKSAGIHTVMITGDHASTALFIAKSIGIATNRTQVLTALQVDELDDDALAKAIEKITVFARVSPRHKIRIVQAFQANDHVVAMTGDGVNDAPAIKGADIGIAVGSGTDVAKETADMVLLDNNFKTIVAAVEEGRTMYQNIKKVVLYLFSGTFAEVVMVTGTMIAGLPLPALPVQILWVNIVEDSFPNISLAFDKGDKENMTDPPRKKDEPLMDAEMKQMIIWKSVILNIFLFGIFWYYYKSTGDIALTRTIVFVGFAIDSLFSIFSMRSLRKMIWQINPFSNRYLLAAVAFGWSMLLGAIYIPALQTLLQTVPLASEHWIVMICFGLVSIAIIETIKAIFLSRMYGNKSG